jgi:hypothetical protein
MAAAPDPNAAGVQEAVNLVADLHATSRAEGLGDADDAVAARAAAIKAVIQKEAEYEMNSTALVVSGGKAIPAFKLKVTAAKEALEALQAITADDVGFKTALASTKYALDLADQEEEDLLKMQRQAHDYMRRGGLIPADLEERKDLIARVFVDMPDMGQQLRTYREHLREITRNTEQAAKNFKPPVVTIRKFTGEKMEEYLSFKEQFTATFGAMVLSDSQRFHYLRDHLGRDAYNIISKLEIEDQSYDLAWKMLDDVYGDKILIRNKLMSELLNLAPYAGNTPMDLRKYHSLLSVKYHRLLVSDPRLATQHEVLLPVLQKCLPYQLKRDIHYQQEKDPDSVPELLEGIDKVIKADTFWKGGLKNAKEASSGAGGSKGASSSGGRSGKGGGGATMSGMAGTLAPSQRGTNSKYGNKQSKGGSQRQGGTPKKGGPPSYANKNAAAGAGPVDKKKGKSGKNVRTCPLCSGGHHLAGCEDFKKMNVTTRKEKVVSLRLCYNCLGDGHVIGECKSKYGCQHKAGKAVCGAKTHHTLLHLPKKN